MTFILLSILLLCLGCRSKEPDDALVFLDRQIQVKDLPVAVGRWDWSGWRGNQNNGIAADQDLVTAWSDDVCVRWRTEIPGRGHASPIVIGDHVVVATAIQFDGLEQQRLVAYDRVSGERLWNILIHEGNFPPSRQMHPKSTHANSTPVSDGTHVYVAMLNNARIHVSSIDLSGKIVWQQSVGKFNSMFGYAPSPLLYKSLVVVAADNQGGGYLAALDRDSGRMVWRIGRGNASSYSSPMIASLGQRDQLLLSGGYHFSSYDPASGKLLWQVDSANESTCGTVAVAGDRVFASGGYPDQETMCVSADGTILWSNRTKIYEPSMIVFDDHLFAVSDDGIAYCWNVSNGDCVWRERLGGKFSGSPVVCNGNLYVCDLSGTCYVFKAAASGYQPISKNQIGDDVYASPAIAYGAIFLRIGIGEGDQREEQLVCIGKPD